jgi:hypothetical protein
MNEPVFVACVILSMVASLVYSFVLFDELVRAEYEQHQAAWQNDGRPRGFFWHAPENGFLHGYFSRQRLSSQWLFSTPDWVSRSPKLSTKLVRYRIAMMLAGVTLVFQVFVFRSAGQFH